MSIDAFIKNLANLFDDTDVSKFKPQTKFTDLAEWSSLIALAVLNMVEKKYGITLTFGELKSAITIQDLYDTLQSKL